ncbi:MAG: hypothetical protein D3903_18180 [Candidatus Electrothrix sp. GM3_4]|nr:hypothetical protein [Candidatus Electrothrix sp. GM3_4]
MSGHAPDNYLNRTFNRTRGKKLWNINTNLPSTRTENFDTVQFNAHLSSAHTKSVQSKLTKKILLLLLLSNSKSSNIFDVKRPILSPKKYPLTFQFFQA